MLFAIIPELSYAMLLTPHRYKTAVKIQLWIRSHPSERLIFGSIEPEQITGKQRQKKAAESLNSPPLRLSKKFFWGY
jgi:hypothetical protein